MMIEHASMSRWNAWERLLADVGRASTRIAESRVGLFDGVRGAAYNGALMVVGRASRLTDWTWAPEEFQDTATRAAAIEQLRMLEAEPGCPLSWVSERWGRPGPTRWRTQPPVNTLLSPFWRGIRGVQCALRLPGHQEDGWPSHLWFSNLLRVAPKDGGRPKSALHRAQLPAATLLLREEIMRAAPERLLFLTGWDYLGDLRDELGVAWEPGESSDYAERAGLLRLDSARDVSVVVAMHPQGLPEAEWVQAIQNAFARLRTEGRDRQSRS